jgi:hypothetical protein
MNAIPHTAQGNTLEKLLSLRLQIDEIISTMKGGCPTPPVIDGPKAPEEQKDRLASENRRQGIYHVDLMGEKIDKYTIADTLQAVLLKLSELDDQFLHRLSLKSTGSRRIVARDPEKIYPHAPRLSRFARPISKEWWMDTNISQTQLKARLRIICDVAEINFGSDLVFSV